MTDKKHSLKNHIYEGKLKDYEQVLVDFVMESGKAKSIDPNLQLILAYIGIHKKLTQKQLKELTNLSMGTISKKIRKILALKIIKKERIPNSNSSHYIVSPESYESTADATLEEFTKMNEFLKEKIGEIEEIKDRRGARFLIERLNELTETFETVKNIWSDIEFIFKQKLNN